jgi:hypothetical protein
MTVATECKAAAAPYAEMAQARSPGARIQQLQKFGPQTKHAAPDSEQPSGPPLSRGTWARAKCATNVIRESRNGEVCRASAPT